MSNPTRDIPVWAGKRIAYEYGYDQIIIIGRKVGDDGREHVTTYGKNKDHCAVAARIGDFLKSKIMGWTGYKSEVVRLEKQLAECRNERDAAYRKGREDQREKDYNIAYAEFFKLHTDNSKACAHLALDIYKRIRETPIIED